MGKGPRGRRVELYFSGKCNSLFFNVRPLSGEINAFGHVLIIASHALNRLQQVCLNYLIFNLHKNNLILLWAVCENNLTTLATPTFYWPRTPRSACLNIGPKNYDNFITKLSPTIRIRSYAQLIINSLGLC